MCPRVTGWRVVYRGETFPGIGNAAVDSLLELPMMGDSLEQLRHFNVVPFEMLINEGLLDGISAAGCGVPNISPDETHACLPSCD